MGIVLPSFKCEESLHQLSLEILTNNVFVYALARTHRSDLL